MKTKTLITGILFAVVALASAATNDLTSTLQRGLFEEEANHNLDAAAQAYQTVSTQFDKDRKLAATAIFRLGEVYRKQGKTNEATAQYERIVREFSDQQTLVTLSRQNLAGIGAKSESPISPLTRTARREQRKFLEEEIKLVEQDLADLRKQLANGVVPQSEVRAKESEVLKLRQQVAALNVESDDVPIPTGFGNASEEAGRLAAQLKGIEQLQDNLEEQARAVLAFFPDETLKKMLLQLPKLQEQEAIVRGNPTLQYDKLSEKLAGKIGYSPTGNGSSWHAAYSPDGLEPERHSTNLVTDAQVELKKQLSWIKERVDFTVGVQKARLQVLQAVAAKTPDREATAEKSVAATDEEEKEIRRIQEMIRNSPDLINAPGGGGGFIPLGNAARLGQLRVAKFLLDAGAKVDLPSAGASPIHYAAAAGHKAMVELLLERGADVNTRDSSGKTPLHAAAENGFQSVLEALLARKADLDAQTKKQETPLSLAAAKGHSAMVELLIARGAKIEVKAEKGWTALMWAAFQGHADVVKRLLGAKADPNAQDTSGRTVLSYAVERGHLDMVKLLLEANADPNAGQKDLPLVMAARSKELEIADLLLRAGAKPDLASKMSQPVTLPGQPPSGFGGSGPFGPYTPLQIAVSRRDAAIVKLLFKFKADPNAKDPWFSPAIPLVFHALGNLEIFAAFLDFGVDPDSRDSARPLIVAAADQDASRVEPLIAHGAKVNVRGSFGNWPDVTPLHVAAIKGDSKSVELLLNAKADVNATTPDGWTALPQAVGNGSKDIVDLLLAHGADVNAKNQNGQTPLHWAVNTGARGIGSAKMIELLLSKGADPNIRNNDGLTPLDLAKGKGGPPPPPIPSGLIAVQRPPGIQTQAQPVDIATVLREHGALDDLPDFTSIRVTRVGIAQPMVVFSKDTNSVNRFTLLEVVRNFYPASGNYPGIPLRDFNRGMPFPDFSKVIIHRPIAGKPGAQKEITVNLLTVSNSFDCAKDTWLEFGDVVEIPEREHALAEQPIGMMPSQHGDLGRCFGGKVTFVVRGQQAELKLDGFASTGLLQSALTLVQNLLRSSSDLSHIKIKRTDPATGKTNEFLTDSKSSGPNNLWLRNGDVIDVPDKP